MLQAVKQNGLALHHAGANLQEDRALVLEAVQQNGLALRSAAASLQEDHVLVLEAVKQHGLNLRHVRAKLYFQLALRMSADQHPSILENEQAETGKEE